MPQIFANIVSPRSETPMWHQFFTTLDEIENFTPKQTFTCVGALSLVKLCSICAEQNAEINARDACSLLAK